MLLKLPGQVCNIQFGNFLKLYSLELQQVMINLTYPVATVSEVNITLSYRSSVMTLMLWNDMLVEKTIILGVCILCSKLTLAS